jgi:hypothetical protein
MAMATLPSATFIEALRRPYLKFVQDHTLLRLPESASISSAAQSISSNDGAIEVPD